MGRSKYSFSVHKSLMLLLILTLCLTSSFTDLSGFGVTTVQAATASGTWGKNITWKFKNGTLTISGKGAMQDTPRKLVSGRGWVYDPICSSYKEKVTKVVIENGVTAIGERNFYYWYYNIKTVVLPKSLKKIGDLAFGTGGVNPYEEYPKSKLNTINFPQGLKSIGELAFKGCGELTSIDLPSSVESIGYGAFADCNKITAVKIRNKNCNIDHYHSFPTQAIIYGYKGSTAEQYTQKYGSQYVHQFRVLTTPAKIKVTKVRITNAPTSLKVGKSITLKAAVTPKNATNKKVTWKVSNTKYAKITTSGKLTAKKAGKGKTLRVSATAKDGSKKHHVVKIKLK